MKLHVCLLALLLAVPAAPAQVTHIVVPAGTPEDVAIQEMNKENDAEKRFALAKDFLQKFGTNPMAAAYGNLQIAQYYASNGDLGQALAYGDKASAAMPGDLEILASQANLALQAKDYLKAVDYAARGGTAIQGIGKQRKPEDLSDQEFAQRAKQEREGAQQSYDYLETLALSAISSDPDAKNKITEAEKFESGFPKSKYEAQVVGYAVVANLNDAPRLATYAEKAVAASPDNASLLSVLASALVETSTYFERAMDYARKAVALAKADAPDADSARKLAAGTAHTALGFGFMKQEKNTAAVAELKTAVALLKDDAMGSQKASYLLAYAYAKLKNYAEARQILNKLVATEGPFQQPARDLLAKVTPSVR